MKRTLIPLGPLLGLICAGCSDVGATEGSAADDVQEGGSAATALEAYGGDDEIPLGRVPQAAKDAALAAVPGLVLEAAELEREGVFCLHGTADGEFYEVEVTAGGDVVEIERGDGDEENDGDEDDDGDEEDND